MKLFEAEALKKNMENDDRDSDAPVWNKKDS